MTYTAKAAHDQAQKHRAACEKAFQEAAQAFTTSMQDEEFAWAALLATTQQHLLLQKAYDDALATFDAKEAAWLQAFKARFAADKAYKVALAEKHTATLALSEAYQPLRKDEDNV